MSEFIKSMQITLTNTNQLIDTCQLMLREHEKLKVTVEPYSNKRGLSANAQVYVWYQQIAKQSGDDVESVRNFCKLMFGLPILLADAEISKKLKWSLDKLGFFGWQHEQQCNFMILLSITSLMSSRQHSEYRESMLNYYNLNGFNLDYAN